jgi:hypothetical protein
MTYHCGFAILDNLTSKQFCHIYRLVPPYPAQGYSPAISPSFFYVYKIWKSYESFKSKQAHLLSVVKNITTFLYQDLLPFQDLLSFLKRIT